jgi:hypothetical protein
MAQYSRKKYSIPNFNVNLYYEETSAKIVKYKQSHNLIEEIFNFKLIHLLVNHQVNMK